MLPLDAVMLAWPARMAVTLPSPSTVATSGFVDFQLTVLSVASSGSTVAVSVAVSPSLRSSVSLSRVTDSTAMVAASTVTLQLAWRPPSLVVTVTVPSPGPTAVTLPLCPFCSTVTTDSGDALHVTERSSALAGNTVAPRMTEPPSVRVMEGRLRLTDCT